MHNFCEKMSDVFFDRGARLKRRSFLACTTVGLLSAVHTPVIAGVRSKKLADFWVKDRWLSLRRSSTGEFFSVPFWVNGAVNWANYVRLCYLLRDVRDGNHTVEMDIELLNLLYGIQEWARLLGINQPIFEVTSGLRTPRHNALLEGAAHDSEHLYGRATDVTMRGVGLNDLASMARFYEAGGVGEYSSFVHIDVGRVRHWRTSPKNL
jgi:uncharacterized protein YcbK (DUF882 family)